MTQLVAQRQAGHLATSTTLQASGPALVPYVGEDDYDAVLQGVDRYHSVVAGDYGRQIDLLVHELPPKIAAWETKNGPVTQADDSVMDESRQTKQRRVLKNVKDALGPEDTAVRSQGLTTADEAHKQDRDKLVEYLDAGLATDDRRLKNSCEWIKTAGKAKLYAVTPTGDSYARLTQGGMNPVKDEAWFPRGLQGSAGDVNDVAVSYVSADLADNKNVRLEANGKDTNGWNLPGLIAITNAARQSKEAVWETLRHEVQHDADKKFGRDAQAGVWAAAKLVDAAAELVDAAAPGAAKDAAGAAKDAAEAKLVAEKNLQRYKTEYRAYSYQEAGATGTYGALDNSAQNLTHDGKSFSARQLAIFKHIYGDYAYTKTHWDMDSELTGGRHFKDAVAAAWEPDTEAVNKYNSTRVDDFWQKLDAIGTRKTATDRERLLAERDVRPVDAKVSDKADLTVAALLEAVAALTPADAAYILKESPAMDAKIARHLDGDAKAEVETALKRVSAGK